ncbi:NUDIX hydrolase [Streptomyces sp. ME19-01-6]|uniref:NUDIX hydrolase n=1 Tax=Streptomyces sp. ME19-01-6 TaxID=3028686 RepID=UPI0029A37B92|nr:NUDIX hydrolase [Streptomyces sp. ME19-01-6]MDX3225238.1 NUDIX hydrolase [Streptomyces sp. ME19-01-6]
MEVTRVAAGIIRSGDDILLVEQKSDGRQYWSLPGGVVEPHETAVQGLLREVTEETGMRITDIGRIAHVTEIRSQDLEWVVIATVFEVAQWHADTDALWSCDPAGEVIACKFLPVSLALEYLSALPWPSMSEPITDHLNGAGRPYYAYVQSNGRQQRAGEDVSGIIR